MSKPYTVEEVLDLTTGNIYPADFYLSRGQYFLDNLREKLEIALQDTDCKGHLVCGQCLQKLKVRRDVVMKNNQLRRAHFAHFKDTDSNCPYKTDRKYSKEEMRLKTFANVKESVAHKELKFRLHQCLVKDPAFDQAKQEEHIRGTESDAFRRPDVSAFHGTQKVVFEVQLTTTFLDVIVGRNEFYRREGIHILWLFQQFNPDKTVQTENDIFNTNQTNSFVFDEEAYSFSLLRGKLHFWCYYLKPYIEGAILQESWQKELITFEQLVVDSEKTRLYYFNYDQAVAKLKEELHGASVRKSFHDFFCNSRKIWDPNLQSGDRDILNRLEEHTGIKVAIYDTQMGAMLDRKFVWMLLILYSAREGTRVQGNSNLKTMTAKIFIEPDLRQFFHAYAHLCNYYGHEFRHKTYKERREELKQELSSSKQNRRYDPIIRFLFPELLETGYFKLG